MKIIIGLGNIGEKYEKTRHNCGFMALDYFVEKVEKEHGIKVEWKEDKKLKAITTKVPFKNQILFLAKPTTLMNLSGEAVNKILNFFKEPISNLIVIFDDIDLPLGEIRTRQKGSAGTHNGVKSIIEHLGNEDFSRIKVGIESRGTTSPKQQDLSSFVLSEFNEEETKMIKKSLEQGVEELKNLLTTS
jgi:PTH1 family peptidyl-tRNA hydrolase